MGLFLENKDGTWNLAHGHIIQILLIRDKRKKMEIFRRNISVTGVFLERGMELYALFDLAWVKSTGHI